jgi:hypothetical protein
MSGRRKSPLLAKDARNGAPGYFEILKFTLLVSAPVGVVTTTGPVVAPAGTTAVM